MPSASSALVAKGDPYAPGAFVRPNVLRPRKGRGCKVQLSNFTENNCNVVKFVSNYWTVHAKRSSTLYRAQAEAAASRPGLDPGRYGRRPRCLGLLRRAPGA